MPFDRFERTKANEVAAARDAFPIVPHDVDELASLPRGIYIGGAGTLVVDMVGYQDDSGVIVPGQTDVVFTVVAGSTLIIAPSRVKTASTATLLVALL